MATETITICCCDICGKRIEKPYYGGESGTYTMNATEDLGVAAGPGIHWKELCSGCNSWLGRTISDLLHYSKTMKEQDNE